MDVKTMFAPKKGKPATKGQKQIEDENRKTIRNYSIAIGVTLITQFCSPVHYSVYSHS